MGLREYKREWEEMGGGSLAHGFGYAGVDRSIVKFSFFLNIHGNYVLSV